jgi:protein-disulfide isomerase
MDSSVNKTTMWFIIGFVVIVVVGFIILGVVSGGGAGTAGSSTSTPAGFVATTVPPIASTDWSEGNPNAKVTLIEYGDFECPACGAYFPLVQQIIANYSSTILFAFRNYPLYSIHPDAGIAAQAAEAAGLQGKYWPMHDLLYTDQTSWVASAPSSVVAEFFNGYASQLGLNVTQFDTDINSSKVINKIANDVTTGNDAQVDHTPTFFVNDAQIPNPTSLADFESVLNAAIASSTGGTSTAQ